MENKMFCFQCEQTAGCSGCTGVQGVCGKSAETANLQDELTGALIGNALLTNFHYLWCFHGMNKRQYVFY